MTHAGCRIRRLPWSIPALFLGLLIPGGSVLGLLLAVCLNGYLLGWPIDAVANQSRPDRRKRWFESQLQLLRFRIEAWSNSGAARSSRVSKASSSLGVTKIAIALATAFLVNQWGAKVRSRNISSPFRIRTLSPGGERIRRTGESSPPLQPG